MDVTSSMALLEKKFQVLGARIKIASRPRGTGPESDFRLRIGNDQRGEFFDLTVYRDDVDFQVVDLCPADRHLLLSARFPDENSRNGGFSKMKFLCGHDERHWFAAGVANRATTVISAKEELKPQIVKETQDRLAVRPKERNRRRNPGFIRQGEWFFIPEPGMKVDERFVLRDEPLRRGGGKPHRAEFLYRTGGSTVYVSPQFRNGISGQEYSNIIHSNPEAKRWRWRTMTRNPNIYVKGRVRHSDHKTICLPFWHRVADNQEVMTVQNVVLD